MHRLGQSRLAAFHFRREKPGHTLQPTAIVHEVFLRLNHGRPVEWQDRAHFFAVFSRNVRQVLVDHARRRRAQKRRDTAMEWPAGGANEPALEFESLLTVHRLIDEFDALDPRAAQVVQLRVFGGLTVPEIASTLGISDFTVKKDWNFARAWLLTRLRETGSETASEK